MGISWGLNRQDSPLQAEETRKEEGKEVVTMWLWVLGARGAPLLLLHGPVLSLQTVTLRRILVSPKCAQAAPSIPGFEGGTSPIRHLV